MRILSSAFFHNGTIPLRFTARGDNLSPPLRFEDVPPNAHSLALIMDDPDAPHGTFDHWVAWNLSKDELFLPEGIQGLTEGSNGLGENGYFGPKPPLGPAHRYFFKLYALNTVLDLPFGATKKQLEDAMEGHIIATAQLVGLFQTH